MLEIHFGDHPVDFKVALSTGAFSRILVDILVDVPVDFQVDLSVKFLIDLSVCVAVDCLQWAFWLVGRTRRWAFGLSVYVSADFLQVALDLSVDCVETAISLLGNFVTPSTTSLSY